VSYKLKPLSKPPETWLCQVVQCTHCNSIFEHLHLLLVFMSLRVTIIYQSRHRRWHNNSGKFKSITWQSTHPPTLPTCQHTLVSVHLILQMMTLQFPLMKLKQLHSLRLLEGLRQTTVPSQTSGPDHSTVPTPTASHFHPTVQTQLRDAKILFEDDTNKSIMSAHSEGLL